MEYGVPTSIAAAFSLAEVSCVEARATEDKGVGLFVAASEVPSGTTLVSSRLSSCILASDLRGELHEHLAPDDTYGARARSTKLRFREHDIRCGTTLPNYAHLGAFDFL